MKILTSLFNKDKVINGVLSGADKLAFTKEEKAEHFIKLLNAYEPFKIAQRLIALLVTSVYLSVYLICAIMKVLSVWYTQLNEASSELAQMNYDSLHWPFITIVAFYFAGGVINGVKKK